MKVLHSPIFGPFDGVLNVNNHDFPSFLDFDGVDQDTTNPSRERQRLMVSTLILWPTFITG
jgi:hypothetical protein